MKPKYHVKIRRKNFVVSILPSEKTFEIYIVSTKRDVIQELLALTITGWVSNSSFASLLFISVGITSSAVGLRIWTITAGIKKNKSIYKKKKKSMIK